MLFRAPKATRSVPSHEPEWPKSAATPTLAFVVNHEPFYVNWRESLKVMFGRGAVSPTPGAVRLFRRVARKPVGSHKGALSASIVVHFALVLSIAYLPRVLPMDASAAESPSSRVKIYYRIPLQQTVKVLPKIARAGQGGQPGHRASTDQVPKLGSKVSQNVLTAVSKPSLPDNQRQTIFQRSSPPDLRIPTDVKVPNIMLGTPTGSPRAPLTFDPKEVRPVMPARQIESSEAPVVSNAPFSPMNFTNSAHQPRPAIPLSGSSGPLQRSVQAPAGDDLQGDDPNLLAIGVDPAQATPQLSIPAGNRWGDFSIAPPAEKDGVPGGDNGGGTAGGVKQGSTGAGDSSTGIGAGHSGGGGGGDTGSVGTLSIGGSGRGAQGYASLGPTMIESMVYAIPTPVLPRRNSLIVSAGPMGGGGIDVYGALHCDKIYSVFLPMPGKSWMLQYCDPRASASSQGIRTAVIHLQESLVPPDPETRFDFHRLPFRDDKLGKVIVLKGLLRLDGTIGDLQLYQSILPAMDQAALAAFGRWKFRPAMRGGKPVPVEILVGIPPAIPGVH